MAHTYHQEESSPYYPRRARWYAFVFRFSNALRRHLFINRLTPPEGIKWGELLAYFFIPFLAVSRALPWLWACVLLPANILLFLVLIIWLGYPAANIAFGLLISFHATGFILYCEPLLRGYPLRQRLLFTLLVLGTIGFLVYYPARLFAQKHWVTPLNFNGRVVVVQRISLPTRIQAGNVVAYALHDYYAGHPHAGGAVRVESGLGLARVQAVAGDQITFAPGSFSVNGHSQPSLPHMPQDGSWVVPENHWFIWPNLDISGHGYVGDSAISSAMMKLADVSQDQFYGQALRSWFGRKQILP